MSETDREQNMVWQTSGGDNCRRGCFKRAVKTPSQPAQRLSTRGAVQASVVFDSAGTAFIADMSGAIQAFSPAGKLLWSATLDGGISATPVVHPKTARLFAGTHNGSVHALDIVNGSVIWKKAIPTKSDPRILSDLLYLAGADAVVLSSWGGRFYALGADTGAERFSWDAGISPGAAASADSPEALYCLRAISGKGVEFVRVSAEGKETILHTVNEDKKGARRTLLAAAPVIDPQRGVAYVIVNQDQGALLHAWSLKSNTLLWTSPLPACINGTPALLEDGTLAVADLAGFAHGINQDGSSRFRYASGCEYLLASGVGEASGAFFFGDPLGMLHAIDAQGVGKPVFEARRSIQARPSFDLQGRLFMPATDRTVYVFSES